MKGGFDLYGNYYPNLQDALDAEMEQIAEIDARHVDHQRMEYEEAMRRQYEDEMYQDYLKQLEEDHL